MLVGNFCRLRIIDSTDAEWVRKLRNSPSIARWHLDRFFISDLKQQDFVRKLATSTTHIVFIAEFEGTRFGVFMIKDIDYRNQRGEWGLYVDPDVENTGIPAFEASVLLIDHAFSYLNLHKLVARVISRNSRALRMDEGLGMIREGVLRKHSFCDGEFHDTVMLAIFRDEFYGNPPPGVKHILDNLEAIRGASSCQPEEDCS